MKNQRRVPLSPTFLEVYDVLFRIVLTWQQRAPVGHDLVMAARSIVRQVTPDEYADLMRRWPDTKPSPLQLSSTVNSESPDSEKKREEGK